MDDRFTDETPTHSLQRVLLVEDDPTYAAVAKAILQSSPSIQFHLNTVKTSAEGLKYLEQHGADIVLLDLTLPDCQGLDSFERMSEFVLEIPVIVLTGVDDEELAIRAVEKGAQDYLVKF